MDTSEKTVVVSGGSSGIGRAIAEKLLGMGHRVFVLSRKAESSDLAERENCVALNVDLRSVAEIEATAKKIEAEAGLGKIDVLVNCAGIGYGTPILEVTEKLYEDFMNTNFRSMVFLTKFLLPLMPENSIICNISSICGIKGFGEWSLYTASKHAVEGFSKELRHEVRDRKIKVMVVRPGSIDTPLYDFIEDQEEKKAFIQPKSVADVVVPGLFLEPNAVVEELFINNSVGDL